MVGEGAADAAIGADRVHALEFGTGTEGLPDRLVDEGVMPAYTPAEMQRTSLLNLILKVKMIAAGEIYGN